jgi:ubiquinone/menaquinone biosynthesis C-methylase UbiE
MPTSRCCTPRSWPDGHNREPRVRGVRFGSTGSSRSSRSGPARDRACRQRPAGTLPPMGVYSDQVVPRLTNRLLGTKEFGKLRREACEGLQGDVIEVGFGSGLNVAHLPDAVTGVWAVEPSGTATKLAAKRIAASPTPVQVVGVDGARLGCPDRRFDAALSTMTLCTIPDVRAALQELRRVLKPGASFHFAEHGRAPVANVARAQDRFNAMQMRLAGGCHLNRDIVALITDAGFEIEQLRTFFLKGPKAWGYMSIGWAQSN